MALTESKMIALGTEAPDFKLLDVVSGKMMRLADFPVEKALVITFICNHCPYVIHVNDELVRLANDYSAKGVTFVAISSNDVVRYPQDSPEKMKELAAEVGYPFPYLYDETQEVARAYDAACTPDNYVFDADRKLAYRGQLDGSRPGNAVALTGEDIRAALDNVIAGTPLVGFQRPSSGCGIKWKQ